MGVAAIQQGDLLTRLRNWLVTSFETATHVHHGEVCKNEDYIPELKKTDGRIFGTTIVTKAGDIYGLNRHGEFVDLNSDDPTVDRRDIETQVTIQSAVKPFILALALEKVGVEGLAPYLGHKEGAYAHNAHTLDELRDQLPPNAMMNAGALVATSVLLEETRKELGLPENLTPSQYQDIEDHIVRKLSAMARKKGDADSSAFAVSSETYQSEKAVRNNIDIVEGREIPFATDDRELVLHLYTRLCSVLVDTTDLAMMYATLNNKGVNPATGDQVIKLNDEEHAYLMRDVQRGGMYNTTRTGMKDWISKSSVSGFIASMVPWGSHGSEDVLSVVTLAPAVDEFHNPCRGQNMHDSLIKNLHLI